MKDFPFARKSSELGTELKVAESKITLSLGFSHPVEMIILEGSSAEIDKDTKHLVLSGIDQTEDWSIQHRNLVLSENQNPIKERAIRYVGEHVRRKALESRTVRNSFKRI